MIGTQEQKFNSILLYKKLNKYFIFIVIIKIHPYPQYIEMNAIKTFQSQLQLCTKVLTSNSPTTRIMSHNCNCSDYAFIQY